MFKRAFKSSGCIVRISIRMAASYKLFEVKNCKKQIKKQHDKMSKTKHKILVFNIIYILNK